MKIRVLDLYFILAVKYLYICCDQLGLSLLRQNGVNTLPLNIEYCYAKCVLFVPTATKNLNFRVILNLSNLSDSILQLVSRPPTLHKAHLTEQNYKDGFIPIFLCQAYILNWVRFYCLSWWPGPFLITIHLSSQDFLFIDFLWICLSVLTSHHLLFVKPFYLMKLKLKPFFPWHDIWQLYPVEIGAKSIFDVLFIVTRFPIPVCYYIWRLAKRGEIGNRLTRFSFQWSSWDEDNLVPESSFLWHLSMILSIFHFLWHLSTNLINFSLFVTPSHKSDRFFHFCNTFSKSD